MYKVIIVDDELLVISSLKNRVKWNEQGFEVVGEARNGIAAYEKIIELKPDVVFTDIRMAGMNGLELIQKANELSLNIQFVVISGYAEFAYAQKAINYGALGFCLKPFDENEIEAILTKIKIKLDKEKASYEALLLSLVEDSSQDGRVLREETLRKLGFASEAGKEFAMAVSIGPTALDLRGEYKNICLKIGKNKYVYISEFSSKTSAKALTESQIFDCEKVPLDVKGIGISLVYNSYDFINKALEEAYMAAYQFFMNEDKRICRYSNRQQEEIDTVVKELRNALVSKNMASVEDNMGLLDQLFRKGDYYIKHATKVYNMFMYLFDREYFENHDNIFETYDQLIGLFNNVHEMLLSLKRLMMENEKQSSSINGEDPGNATYKRILKYLDTQWGNDISVQSIAAKMQINPNYISQLFKKERGETFTEYLTGLRVKHACSMLISSDLPVYEVAEKAGYKDYFHFAKMFKRITGKTPTAYRDDNKKNT